MLVLVTASLIGVTGCDSKVTSPQGGVTPRVELIPLALGNSWVYRERLYGYEDPYTETIDTSRIDSAFMWQGRLWFGSRGGSSFSSNDTAGYWVLTIAEGDTSRTAQLRYRFPVELGESWVWESDTMTVRVTAVGQEVITPAGKFTGCIRYDIVQPEGITNYLTFRPGIGFIKAFYDNPVMTPPISLTNELTSYHVVE